jgi:hypothetical protein
VLRSPSVPGNRHQLPSPLHLSHALELDGHLDFRRGHRRTELRQLPERFEHRIDGQGRSVQAPAAIEPPVESGHGLRRVDGP